MARWTLIACLSLLLPACAASLRAARAQRCAADPAFADGVNDATAGREMDRDHAEGCDAPEVAAVRQAYRDGYLAALARRAPPERGWTCEVSAFGEQFSGIGPTEAAAAARARAACQTRNHEMHCASLACRPGR